MRGGQCVVTPSETYFQIPDLLYHQSDSLLNERHFTRQRRMIRIDSLPGSCKGLAVKGEGVGTDFQANRPLRSSFI